MMFIKKIAVTICSLIAILISNANIAEAGQASQILIGQSIPHIDSRNLSMLWAMPFICLLLSIAIFPLAAPRLWHRHYGKIALFWGLLFISLFTVQFGINISSYYFLEVYLLEFLPFISLLLALYTIAGGIQLKGPLIGTPIVNTGLLILGTFLASWIGTTGAAMLLIRPLIRANLWRSSKTHIIVFFIFLVANIGGALTPMGDPPLFLGFLKGVSFFWTTKYLLKEMIVAVVILIALFFIIDSVYYKREALKPEKICYGEKTTIKGKINFVLLSAVLFAVIASSFNLGTAFTIHHVSMPLSSLIQVSLLLVITCISLMVTPREVRLDNEFTWEPIKEVAKLFAAIFITIVTPIAMLKAGADGPLGAVIKTMVDGNGNFVNSRFFWVTGVLSSFLDNAPTYLIFFETAGGNAAELMTTYSDTLVAISAGAVFMGANTYIGNAPNFMVKSIAEEHGIQMPSFFGYMLKYSIPILIPLFIIITIVFF
jgi:Na+/H+ antiporter NhaD/arsenite permease-like protein